MYNVHGGMVMLRFQLVDNQISKFYHKFEFRLSL